MFFALLLTQTPLFVVLPTIRVLAALPFALPLLIALVVVALRWLAINAPFILSTTILLVASSLDFLVASLFLLLPLRLSLTALFRALLFLLLPLGFSLTALLRTLLFLLLALGFVSLPALLLSLPLLVTTLLIVILSFFLSLLSLLAPRVLPSIAFARILLLRVRKTRETCGACGQDQTGDESSQVPAIHKDLRCV